MPVSMIEVLEHLQHYMVKTDNPAGDCLVSGDGLSVERMIHAQRARTNGEQQDQRLSSMWPCPQEFHKEVLLLQVQFFNGVYYRLP
jgi:hypothetical protein